MLKPISLFSVPLRFTILGLMIVATFTPGQLEAKTPERLPKTFTLKGLKQGKFRSKDLKKHDLTIISFYASWCNGCKKTMYKLDKISERFDGVRWLGISVDETMADAKDYFKHLPKKFKQLDKKAYFDKDLKLARTVDVDALPAYIIVNKRGDVIHEGTGHPTRKELAEIRKVLKSKKHAH